MVVAYFSVIMSFRRVNWSYEESDHEDSPSGRIHVRREDGRYRRPPWWANQSVRMLLALIATLLLVRLIYVLAVNSVA